MIVTVRHKEMRHSFAFLFGIDIYIEVELLKSSDPKAEIFYRAEFDKNAKYGDTLREVVQGIMDMVYGAGIYEVPNIKLKPKDLTKMIS
jgi:hypothetical protein